MKKLVLSLAMVGAAVISCQKTKVSPAAQASSNLSATEGTVKTSNARTKPSYRILFLSNDKKYCFCVSKGGNCLPDVVVRPNSAADFVINQTRDAVDKGQAEVQKLFSAKRDLLVSFLEAPDVDGVIKGELIVNNAISEDGATRFFIFRKASTNEIEIGYPFVY